VIREDWNTSRPSRRGWRNGAGPSAAKDAFQQASRTVPIVFVATIDPVGGGYVESLSRPGTNATGFASFEFSMSGKWLELLKEIAPDVRRVAVIRDPSVPAGSGGLAAIQTVAPSLGVELTPVGVRDAGEIERACLSLPRRCGSTFNGYESTRGSGNLQRAGTGEDVPSRCSCAGTISTRPRHG
jgi:ABC-type uncharacterized transport system substrate-binding protein